MQIIVKVSEDDLLDFLADKDEALYSLVNWDLIQVFLNRDLVEFTVRGELVDTEEDFPDEENTPDDEDENAPM